MWWLGLGGVLLIVGTITARPGMGRIAVALIISWLFFEISQRWYLLPLSYYKDGGNGPAPFDPFTSSVWLLHAILWSIPAMIAGRAIRRAGQRMVARSGR